MLLITMYSEIAAYINSFAPIRTKNSDSQYLGMLEEPHVRALGEKLRACIDKALPVSF